MSVVSLQSIADYFERDDWPALDLARVGFIYNSHASQSADDIAFITDYASIRGCDANKRLGWDFTELRGEISWTAQQVGDFVDAVAAWCASSGVDCVLVTPGVPTHVYSIGISPENAALASFPAYMNRIQIETLAAHAGYIADMATAYGQANTAAYIDYVQANTNNVSAEIRRGLFFPPMFIEQKAHKPTALNFRLGEDYAAIWGSVDFYADMSPAIRDNLIEGVQVVRDLIPTGIPPTQREFAGFRNQKYFPDWSQRLLLNPDIREHWPLFGELNRIIRYIDPAINATSRHRILPHGRIGYAFYNGGTLLNDPALDRSAILDQCQALADLTLNRYDETDRGTFTSIVTTQPGQVPLELQKLSVPSEVIGWMAYLGQVVRGQMGGTFNTPLSQQDEWIWRYVRQDQPDFLYTDRFILNGLAELPSFNILDGPLFRNNAEDHRVAGSIYEQLAPQPGAIVVSRTSFPSFHSAGWFMNGAAGTFGGYVEPSADRVEYMHVDRMRGLLAGQRMAELTVSPWPVNSFIGDPLHQMFADVRTPDPARIAADIQIVNSLFADPETFIGDLWEQANPIIIPDAPTSFVAQPQQDLQREELHAAIINGEMAESVLIDGNETRAVIIRTDPSMTIGATDVYGLQAQALISKKIYDGLTVRVNSTVIEAGGDTFRVKSIEWIGLKSLARLGLQLQ